MPNINDINGVTVANLAKLDAVLKANISKVNGLTLAAAFTGLLDTYTGAAAAYSTRKLKTGVTVAARIRRSGDDIEADVEFDSNNEISLTSPISNASSGTYTDLADFVDHSTTPRDAFVDEWKDQSGSGNHAAQATAANQPKLYDATTGLITDNGKPAIDFANDELLSSFSLTSDQTVAAVVTSRALGIETVLSSAGGVGMGRTTGGAFYQSSTSGDTDNIYGAYVTDEQQLHFVYRDSVTSGDSFGRINGTQGALDIDGTGTVSGTFKIGQLQLSGYSFDGFIQELILWDDQSANKTGIESDIMTYFSIT